MRYSCFGKACLKPGSHMPSTYLRHGRKHGLGQSCPICEHLSPTHNLSQALTTSLPAKLIRVQLCRQANDQCLGQIMCQQYMFTYVTTLRQAMLAAMSHASLQSMAELDEISRVQSHFSPHFLLTLLIYLAHALAILCKLGPR